MHIEQSIVALAVPAIAQRFIGQVLSLKAEPELWAQVVGTY